MAVETRPIQDQDQDPRKDDHGPIVIDGVVIEPEPELVPGVEPELSDNAKNGAAPGRITRKVGETVPDPDAVLDANGRTYHNFEQSPYMLPNDGDEQDRLDLQHLVIKLVHNGKLYAAPVEKPANVADIATGTGIWAIEFAREHPESNVIGTDLSKIQPKSCPPNCSFIRENSEMDEWSFPYKLDYVHMRAVVACFKDTPRVFRKAFEHLNPGGWLEVFDADFLLRSDGTLRGTALERWNDLVIAGGARSGIDFRKVLQYPAWLEAAGFVDVRVVHTVLPCNTWPRDPRWKEWGRWGYEDLVRLTETMRKLLEAAGLGATEIDDFLPQVRADMRNTNIHWVLNNYTVYARKP